MKLGINEAGWLTLERPVSVVHDVFVGPVQIGTLAANAPGAFPLHALAGRLDLVKRYGVHAVDRSTPQQRISVDVSAFVDAYAGDDGLLEWMRGRVRGGRWGVNRIGIDGRGVVSAECGIVLPRSLSGRSFEVTCNGIRPTETIVHGDATFEHSHWFMPVEDVLGVSYRYPPLPITDWLTFDVVFHDASGDAADYRSILNHTRPAEIIATMPPVERIRRVSGQTANQISFANGGRTAFVRLVELARELGVDVDDPRLRVLDWGVGCGRVLRHFESLPSSHLFGLDIDASNVSFCNETLRSTSYAVGLEPPTPIESGSIDLIISCSVLSHLDESATDLWLAEMSRILSPRGVGLLSFNGSGNAVSYLSRRPDELRKLHAGMLFDRDRNADLDGFIPSADYYRATFGTDEWWRAKLGQHLDLVDVRLALVSGHQDVAVVRRRR